MLSSFLVHSLLSLTWPGSFGTALLVQAEDGTKLVCKAVDVSAASSKETQDRKRRKRAQETQETQGVGDGWTTI